MNISNLLNPLPLSLNPFKSLPDSSYILLLTPYLHALSAHTKPEDKDMDPFEPFGRALQKCHRSIRHLLFIAKRGIGAIHRYLLKSAGGVIVVICKPPTLKEDRPLIIEENRLDVMKYQKKFANDVENHIKELSVPSLLVTVGVDKGTELLNSFQNSLELSDWSELGEATDRICDC